MLVPLILALTHRTGIEHLVAVFLGLTLLALGIAAIGLVCSSFTTSQIIAAAATVAFAYVLYDFGWTHAFVSEEVAGFLDAISLRTHFRSFAEGMIFLDDVAYFAGLTALSFSLCRAAQDLQRVFG